MSEENLALLRGRTVGVVLVEMLGQVSVVVEFDEGKDAKQFFRKFLEAPKRGD